MKQGTDALSQCTQCCGLQECQQNIQIFRLVRHGLDKLSFYSELLSRHVTSKFSVTMASFPTIAHLEIPMPQTVDINRQIVLAERPKGQPDENTLQMATTEIPQPSAGEMLVRTVYLSLDPYMRGRMNDAKSYAEPVAIGGVMTAQVVGQVVTSNLDGYEAGDYVLSGSGWQDYATSDGAQVINLGRNPDNPSWTLGILGMPGYTAYAGLLKIGEPKPGETVVVAAATGPVGATVGQIAKLKGCRVVGIAGGAKKCAHVVENLGFDACIDHKADDFAQQLKDACPDGVDVYFENVGGKVFEAVLPHLNVKARITLCGMIAQYGDTGGQSPRDVWLAAGSAVFSAQKVQVHPLFVGDYVASHQAEFLALMGDYLRQQKIVYLEDFRAGLEVAPTAFAEMLRGGQFW